MLSISDWGIMIHVSLIMTRLAICLLKKVVFTSRGMQDFVFASVLVGFEDSHFSAHYLDLTYFRLWACQYDKYLWLHNNILRVWGCCKISKTLRHHGWIWAESPRMVPCGSSVLLLWGWQTKIQCWWETYRKLWWWFGKWLWWMSLQNPFYHHNHPRWENNGVQLGY